VAAGSGGPIDNNSDLLKEIRDALRGRDDGEPNVVQAINNQTSRLVSEWHNIARAGGFGGSTMGGAPPGEHHEVESNNVVLTELRQVLGQLERAVQALEGIGEHEGHGTGNDTYFQRDVMLRNIQNVNTMSESLSKGTLTLESFFGTFHELQARQLEASIQNLLYGFMNIGLHATNLGTAFRNLHSATQQQLVGLKDTGVFGSNMLSPMQYFLEGLTRIREGILTTSDSFRTVTQLVNDSLERGVLSPLLMTGKAAAELAVDFNQARSGMRQNFGVDTRAWMSTRESDALLAEMLSVTKKFGIQGQTNDIMIQGMAAQELSVLQIIASMTGQTVAKLEEQAKANRDQQQILIGMGRLNRDEYQNYGLNQEVLKSLGAPGLAVSQTIAKMLASGRSGTEILANNPEMQSFAASQPQMWSTMIRLMDQMTRKSSPQEILNTAKELGSGGFQDMAQIQQKNIYGGFMNDIANMVVAGKTAQSLPAPDAAQRAHGESDPVYGLIGRITEIWQQQIQPFMRLETAIGAQVAALILNTGALWSNTAARGGGSILGGGMLGAAGRVVGPLAAGVAGAGVAYAGGSSTEGVVGSGVGSVAGSIAGAALGSLAGPVGTMIGMTAGGILGGIIGERLGTNYGTASGVQSATATTAPPSIIEKILPSSGTPTPAPPEVIEKLVPNYQGPSTGMPAVAPPTNIYGPDFGAASGDTARTVTYQDSSVNLLSNLVVATQDGNMRLAQIHGELSRQTEYLGADNTAGAASAPAMGIGLAANVASRSSGRPDASYPQTPV
jgi:hypothetical protein